ncbi:aminotransferase class I/II-fold pyridoxal phosphate-dependent enzyme [Salipiger sp. IMCC34102]|uniref:pyridoxal phosphate-dependent aminotransferase n=1 Tax=Salipiger sp. IMCC34102 TaxID=2510647 RepID=UPI00101DFD53|nr:aminotransferase class I/II-fold pyridoxal phosphate-dependent enzyme [Salipiger sp. IMCC34102]RYH03464.1 aminotransferase class I/II-fold pyridoxal phosphate-dependent enzyme [Salipiger sp. IMCC34102]
MKLSDRIQNIVTGGDDGWSVFYRARALRDAGHPIIELTMGEHDIGTDRAILDAMHESGLAGHTGYSLVPGMPELRAAVAARLQERTGVPTGSENVVITPGGQAALFAAHAAACDPGDAALFIDPYYATYPGTIRAVGATPRPVRVRAEDGFRPQRADLEATAGPDARSLLINSPNNPTGAVYDRATLEEIAGVCQDRDLWLISDEVYDTQVWEGDHISPRSLDGMAGRTLVVGSMSKSHAMTGSRVGWVAGPAEAIHAIGDLATHNTYGIPPFIQRAALFALGRGTEPEQQVAEPFRRRRSIVLRALDGQRAITASPIDGAMYAMLDVRATGMTGLDFANGLLDAEQIGVMPGESFGQGGAGHIRVAMTVEDSRLEEALGRIVAYAEGLMAARTA